MNRYRPAHKLFLPPGYELRIPEQKTKGKKQEEEIFFSSENDDTKFVKKNAKGKSAIMKVIYDEVTPLIKERGWRKTL